ncbi:hypothetical protein [Phenylobacterium sp.]|uniref:hypothetical protein n=1 Tax=Phenylobacterium sp. TaxID=1871053 RepID=UPI0025D6161E|nr:hypothetical protein [Phenylobacterium sp.]
MIAGVPDAASGWTLAYRHAFDFSRRLGSVLANGPEGDVLVVKGAPEAVVAQCVSSRLRDTIAAMEAPDRAAVLARVQGLAEQGLRAIAIASRPCSNTSEAPPPSTLATPMWQSPAASTSRPWAASG